jgi:hypothetical protein
MKILAVQTGSVRIKTAQVEGRGVGLRRRLIYLPTHYPESAVRLSRQAFIEYRL